VKGIRVGDPGNQEEYGQRKKLEIPV
jgi:hypothetical protein